MTPHFVQRNGEVFRVLVQEDGGCWLISYASPASPFFVSEMEAYERTLPPLPPHTPSAAAQKRLSLIAPLLEAGDAAITDKSRRIAVSKDIARSRSTTYRRVLTLYYRYIATGQVISPKPRTPAANADYDWAISTFYFSAKRLSLRGAYEMMLLQRYTDTQGELAPEYPTWSSFRAYFYSRGYHKQPRKIIARQGLTRYQRDYKPAFGAASEWRPTPGSFQMDATEADIYLVSSLDRNTVVGRPYIYLAVDSATQLIAGVWVGFECDESAVMHCLENAVRDKVEWCGQHGIEIQAEQWPSSGLPYEIVTDRGREFYGGRMEELCQRYGVELIVQPPFRPDRKPLVEKMLHLLQERYKPLLRGKGVIEPDAQERWATDYRTQAVLTPEEFTQVIIHCVLYLNSGRVLSSLTPAQLWLQSSPQLLNVDAEELRLMALPRINAKLTRKGVRVNGVLYVPADISSLHIGDACAVAYDPSNLSCVYLVEHEWRVCAAAPGQGVAPSLSEQDALRKQLRGARKAAEQRSTAAAVECVKGIQSVIAECERRDS